MKVVRGYPIVRADPVPALPAELQRRFRRLREASTLASSHISVRSPHPWGMPGPDWVYPGGWHLAGGRAGRVCVFLPGGGRMGVWRLGVLWGNGNGEPLARSIHHQVDVVNTAGQPGSQSTCAELPRAARGRGTLQSAGADRRAATAGAAWRQDALHALLPFATLAPPFCCLRTRTPPRGVVRRAGPPRSGRCSASKHGSDPPLGPIPRAGPQAGASPGLGAWAGAEG